MVCWSYHTVIICSMFSPDLGSTGKMAQMNAEEPQKKWLLNVCGMASCEWFKLRLLPEKCPFYEHWVWSLSVNFENQTLTTLLFHQAWLAHASSKISHWLRGLLAPLQGVCRCCTAIVAWLVGFRGPRKDPFLADVHRAIQPEVLVDMIWAVMVQMVPWLRCCIHLWKLRIITLFFWRILYATDVVASWLRADEQGS